VEPAVGPTAKSTVVSTSNVAVDLNVRVKGQVNVKVMADGAHPRS
jgi:hypothetical protein